jgi:4-hydroxybenzoate polyprenyltransferase
MSRPGKVRALLATLRIANAPSVVSNVFLGFMLGWIQVRGNYWDASMMDWSRASLACLAGLFLYFSGNLANDWFDQKWDAERRPERALPLGLYQPSAYFKVALLLAAGGVAVASFLHLYSGVVAVAICLSITIYTYFHKKAILAVIPMGLCRAGLYLLGYFASWYKAAELEGLREYLEPAHISLETIIASQLKTLSILAIGLFSYIVGLSLSARYEGMDDAPRGPKVISLMMLILPIPAMSCSFMGYYPMFGIIGMIPFAVWLALCLTRFKKPIPRYVSALLAGIPLVDLVASMPLALGLGTRLVEGNWSNLPHFSAMIVVPVVAFLAGRALQKLAPAT